MEQLHAHNSFQASNVLKQVLGGTSKPDRVIRLPYRAKHPFCPKCHMALPHLPLERPREHRIAGFPGAASAKCPSLAIQ